MARLDGAVSSDQLRIYADWHVDQPDHPNAWGSIFRGKEWQIAGRIKSKYPSNHARWINVWRLRP